MSNLSLVKCPTYEEQQMTAALQATFANLGGIEKYVKPGTKVALKVNLLMEKTPEEATTTHPALVKALVKMIQDAGGEALILDSPGGNYTEKLLQRVYTISGLKQVAEETGARLNFDLSEVEIANPQGKYLKRLTVIKPLVDADLIINLPKLKTHGMMVYTGAVKNLFGAIPGLQKAEFHLRMPSYEDFADALIDIFLSVKPALNIMDAVIGMEGDGPSAGQPYPIGLILASEDAFALDRAAVSIIGADLMSIPVIKQSVERGLCRADLKDIVVIGENLADVRVKSFAIPQLKGKGVGQVDGPLANLIKPKPVFDHSKCVGCADCAKSCPAHTIKMKNKRPEVDLSKCIRCFCCQELCPAKAIEIRRSKVGGMLFKIGASIFYATGRRSSRKKAEN
ncbi:MAG TPA: DUF362 domain-containing protein [Bacillota bacterium]|jgi:uncharacterized protein (DUF362 family)/Pyruvate/2-oxoacid:ferredoxin oxidoreductase delta subunit|nr:DUF362 domain-containing protein [Bacillota bacterium]